MNINRIILLVVVSVVLSISGCSDNSTTSPSNSAPTSIVSSSAPSPTWTAVDTPTDSSQLFHLDSVNWYEYRFTSQSESVHLNMTYKYEYRDEILNGTSVRHSRVILDNSGIYGVFTSKADNSPISGYRWSTMNGKDWTKSDLSGTRAAGYFDGELNKQVKAAKKAKLTGVGQETIIVNGKSYTCTKYEYTVDEFKYIASYTPQAPAPLKVAVIDIASQKPKYTYELTGWG